MSEGGNVPDWAVAFLQTLQAQRDETLRQVDELRLATTQRVAEFRDIRGQREMEYQRLQQAEAVRVNNEIVRMRAELGNGATDFQKYKSEKLAEMARMDSQIKAYHDSAAVVTEEYALLSQDLAQIKKIDLQLDQQINDMQFKNKKTVVSPQQQHAELSPKKPEIEFPPLPPIRWMMEPCTEPGLAAASRAALASAASTELDTTMAELFVMTDMKALQGVVEQSTVQDSDLIAKGIISMFQFYGKDNDLLEWMIKYEVDNTSDIQTLFRAPSIISKMLTAYSRTVGAVYLRETIRPFVLQLIQMNRTLELDPQQLKAGENLADNTRALREAAQAMIVEICNSGSKIPMQMRNICLVLKREVSRKFPNDVHVAVAGFIFLRFFCPAIVSPDVFDPEMPPIPENTRRALLLLAKIIQACANGTHFKESYLVGLNTIISNNIAYLRKFYFEISKPADSGMWARVRFDTMPQIITDLLAGLGTLQPAALQKAEQRISELDKDRLYFRSFSYSPGGRLALLRKSFETNSVAGLAEPNAYVHEFIDFMFDEDKTLINAMTAVCFSKSDQQQLSSFAKAVSSIAIFVDGSGAKTDEMLRAVLRKEFATVASSSPESKKRLAAGFGAWCFRHSCRQFGADYLRSILSPLVATIRRGKSGLSKLNKKGLQFITAFFDDLGKSLPTVPVQVWRICNWLSRQVVDMTAAFWLSMFFAQALDDIDQFGSRLESREKEKLSRKAGLIATVLRKMASGEQFVKSEVKEANVNDVNNWLKSQSDILIRKVETWASTDGSNAVLQKLTIPWDDCRNSLVGVLNFIRTEEASFDMILSKKTDQRCSYKLGNLYFATASLGKVKKQP